jgi:hypothetical protein
MSIIICCELVYKYLDKWLFYSLSTSMVLFFTGYDLAIILVFNRFS